MARVLFGEQLSASMVLGIGLTALAVAIMVRAPGRHVVRAHARDA
jgi:hypothetical protein